MNRKSRTRALRSTDLPAYSAALAAAPHPVRATRHHGNPFNSPRSDITFAVALFYMSESVQPSIYFTGSERETDRGMRVDCIQTDTQQNTEHFQKSACFMEVFLSDVSNLKLSFFFLYIEPQCIYTRQFLINILSELQQLNLVFCFERRAFHHKTPINDHL